MLQGSPYQGYTYAYPHKTAYRKLGPPIPLNKLWATENHDSLFLYMHIPFCEMRCGFCNLFTTVGAGETLEQNYLKTLKRQAKRVQSSLGKATFVRFAIGGGTPTYLEPDDLQELFTLAKDLYNIDIKNVPISVETSPATALPERLEVLKDNSVTRISIGVQSFIETEVKAVGRSQKTKTVCQALQRIRKYGFPTLNIDLIYGLPKQTPETWLSSLKSALIFEPEECYLYPLYVRPLTGLGRKDCNWDDKRLKLYRIGRDFLLEHGYKQISMRMFCKPAKEDIAAPIYCCQNDGMVGLGCGARSYTKELHYSNEYAVGAKGIKSILANYITQPTEDFEFASYGFKLDADEQRRRFILQSLLRTEGLDLNLYKSTFKSCALEDYPELFELTQQSLMVQTDDYLRLTETGLERSDTIGPWLYSAKVQACMDSYEWQ